MGTNYYLHKNVCSHCGRGDDPYHIGKSSAGWCFALHVDPQEGINTLADVHDFIAEGVIKDEYGRTLSVDEMIERITERSASPEKRPSMYVSWDEFHKINHSEPGPNGLVRCTTNSRHCIGHGEGTWDLLIGEFS